MTIPSADELRSIFAAAREHGVTHLRVGGLEVRLALAPPSPPVARSSEGESLVAAINATVPMPGGEDPTELVAQQVAASMKRALTDPLDVISSGGKLLVDRTLGV